MDFSSIITIVIFVLGILISISLHELGHFVPAKLFKCYVSQYFVGFGPKIWSKKIGETEYGIKAIPLGGHTTIEGMFPAAHPHHQDKYFKSIIQGAREESLKGMEGIEVSRAFYNLSTPKKLTVMVGGTFTNLVIGAICIIIAFSIIGTPYPTTTINTTPDSPANAAGLPDGAKITGINGNSITQWSQVIENISNSDTDQILVEYITDGNTEPQRMVISPDGEKGSYKLGIQTQLETKKMTVLDCLTQTGEITIATMKAVVTIPASLANSVITLITGSQRDQNGLVSIIGMGQVAVASDKHIEDLSTKIANMLSLIGSLNIALFVFNLIPLLPLDGGHSANAIYEGIRRLSARIRGRKRPLPSDLARTMPIAYIVFCLLIGMFIIVGLLDILHPIV